MTILDTPANLMDPSDAVELADDLNAEADATGDAWRYEANHDPQGVGLSRVAVYDGDDLLGYL